MTKLLEIIKSRRSIRNFQKKKIPRELNNKLADALRWAPSAGNLQARKFYFISQKEKLAQVLASSTFQQKFNAPMIIVGCTDATRNQKYGERGEKFYAVIDVSLSIQNAMLLAHDLGLGSCWVGAFDEVKVSKALNLPVTERPVVLLPVGYPVDIPPAPQRLSWEEVIVEIK